MEPTTLQINDFPKAIHAKVTFCRKIMGGRIVGCLHTPSSYSYTFTIYKSHTSQNNSYDQIKFVSPCGRAQCTKSYCL